MDMGGAFQAFEVHQVLRQMASLIMPRLNGMSPIFYKSFWHIIGEDVTAVVLKALNSGVVPAEINSTFISFLRLRTQSKFLVFNPLVYVMSSTNRFPMGRVTRDFLINYRLTTTQCSPNIFRVLGSVDMINRKMGTNFTRHDVNWVYNCQKGKETNYYIKCRVPVVRLIFLYA